MATSTKVYPPLSLKPTTRRERWAWYLYDFGNSAYASVVLLAVYSAYFKQAVVGGARGSFLWGLSVGIAMLVVAIISPVLGSIADFSAAKKRFLLGFTLMSVLFTGLLFFAEPGRILIGMLFFILAEIGYRSAQVFYNGLLPEIATQEEIGRVSGIGWAIGTMGGILILLIILPLIQAGEGTLMVRLSLVITAAFYLIFSLPLFFWLKERARPQDLPEGKNHLDIGLFRVFKTLREIKEQQGHREFLKFILAFLIYNDGVIMALDFAAIIGAVLFGMDQEALIIFVILVQLANVAGAYLFGYLTDRWGAKQALLLSLGVMLAAVIWMVFAQTQTIFYLVGLLAGLGMAGVQSISRTMVGMLAPPGESAEFYGFFAVAGRTSSFIGPTIYGWVAAWAAGWYAAHGWASLAAEQIGQRWAIGSIGLFLLVGTVLLLFVRAGEKREVVA